MASSAKASRTSPFYNLDEVLDAVLFSNSGEDSDNIPGGISSGEESELDRQLQNSSDETW
jgi:hypothetical protein